MRSVCCFRAMILRTEGTSKPYPLCWRSSTRSDASAFLLPYCAVSGRAPLYFSWHSMADNLAAAILVPGRLSSPASPRRFASLSKCEEARATPGRSLEMPPSPFRIYRPAQGTPNQAFSGKCTFLSAFRADISWIRRGDPVFQPLRG